MATIEYNDLFLLCQDTGIYHMFTFDIVGSKKMDGNTRKIAQEKIIKLMRSIYQVIYEIQEKTGKRILVFDDDFVTFDSGLPVKGFGMKQEPFLFGDTFGFTIYRDSLDKDVILNIYEYFRVGLNIDFELHINDGYYEPNDYGEGNKKYFRGYCCDLLANYHKEMYIQDINRLRKQLEKLDSN